MSNLSWAQRQTLNDIQAYLLKPQATFTCSHGNSSFQDGRPSTIHEVGFGDGTFLKQLDELRKDIRGVKLIASEISGEAVSKAREQFPSEISIFVPNGKITETDVTCAFEVIEHLKDSVNFLKQLTGDTLYLSTPYKYRWFPQLRQALRSYGYITWFHRYRQLEVLPRLYEYWDHPPNHLSRFSVTAIVEVLNEAGWKSVKAEIAPLTSLDIVRGIISLVRPKELSANYDEMRSSKSLKEAIILKFLLFLCWPIAKYFKRLGYFGGNIYIKAQR